MPRRDFGAACAARSIARGNSRVKYPTSRRDGRLAQVAVMWLAHYVKRYAGPSDAP